MGLITGKVPSTSQNISSKLMGDTFHVINFGSSPLFYHLFRCPFSYVELKRMDTLEKGLDLSFICKADSLQQLSDAKNKITGLSAATRLSIVDQPDLII